jgi:hypothetical protein
MRVFLFLLLEQVRRDRTIRSKKKTLTQPSPAKAGEGFHCHPVAPFMNQPAAAVILVF